MAKPPLNPSNADTIAGSYASDPAPVEAEAASFGQRIADSYRLSWMGQTVAGIRADTGWSAPVDGYDGLQHVPKGYELYADAFMHASNPDETAAIQHEIDLNIAARERRSRLTFGQALGDDLVTGILDPINIIPGARLAGAGLLSGAGRGALTVGATAGLTSSYTVGLDPTAEKGEAAVGTVVGAAIGGVVGGVAGRIGSRTRLTMPGGAARVTSHFGTRKAPKAGASTNHGGVDLAYPMRTPLRTNVEATVTDVRRTAKGGLEVHLDMGGGITSKYLHLDSTAVKKGDRVAPGMVFARTGASGNVTGAHLHWAVYQNGKPIDPLGRVEVTGASPRAPGAAYDIARGIAIPDSVVVAGVDMPVRLKPGSNRLTARMGAVTAGIDDVVRSVGDDLGRGSDEDLIAAYLREGGTITRVKDGRRAIDPRKFRSADRTAREAEGVSVGKDANLVDPQKMMVAGMRVTEFVDELEAHPRFNPARTATKAWVRDLIDESGVDLEAQATRAKAKKGNRPLSQGEVLAMLRWRAEQLVNEGFDNPDGSLVIEAEQHARSRYRRELDEGDLELQAQDRANRRIQTDDGTIRALRPDRPLTPSEKLAGAYRLLDRSPAVEEATDAEAALNGFDLDPDYIWARFDEQPWAGDPLPDGATVLDGDIRSPGQWFNYAVTREIGLAEGLDIPEANARALQAAQEASGPFVHKPGPLGLGDAVLSVSPMGQMKRLVPHDAEFQRSLHRLGGDGVVTLEANEQGVPAVVGGSVEIRRHRWDRVVAEIIDANRRAWLKAMGKDGDRSRLQNEISIFATRLKGRMWGKDSMQAFRHNVARAIVGFDTGLDGTPLTAAHYEAVAAWEKGMAQFEAGSREAGLFTESAAMQRHADMLEKAARQLDNQIKEFEGRGFSEESIAIVREMAEERRGQAEAAKAALDVPLASKTEPRHYSRIWNAEALEADEDRAVAALTEAYAGDGHPSPAQAARAAFESLVADPSGELSAPGMPGYVKARTIPITNKEAFDWIVQDPEVVATIYARRMGSAIEMTRMFGDAHGLIEADRLVADALDRGVEPKKVRQALQVWEDARDRIAGGFHAVNPLSMHNRAAHGLRNMTQIQLMDRSPISQFNDIGRIILTQGLGARWLFGDKDADVGIIGALFGARTGDLSRFYPGGPAREAGEALDIVKARVAAQMIESDDAFAMTNVTAFEKGLNRFTPVYHMLSLLTPMAQAMKELAGLAGASNLLRDVEKVAAGEASAKTLTRLARAGIDEEMARLIASMPIEQGKSGLRLANMAAWADLEGGADAMQAFRSAVNSEVRASVTAPGPLDKPAIADGILHSDRQRLEHQAKIDEAAEKVEQLREQLRALKDLDDAHPAKLDALEALREASGELTTLRRNRGRAGRIDVPTLSLPFQLKSFGLGAAKSMHGLMTGRERNIAGGVMSMIALGWLSVEVRAWIDGRDTGEMSATERASGAIDASGVLGWIGDLGKFLDTVTDAHLIPSNPDRDANNESVKDEASAIAPAVSAIDQYLAPFFADDEQRKHKIRQAIPLENSLLLAGIFDKLERLGADDDGIPSAESYDRMAAKAATGGPEADEPEVKRKGNGLDFGKLPEADDAPAPPKILSADDIAVLPAIKIDDLVNDIDVLLAVYPKSRGDKLRADYEKKQRKAASRKQKQTRSRRPFLSTVNGGEVLPE